MPLPASKAGAVSAPAPTILDYTPTASTPLMLAPAPKFLYRWRPDQWEVVQTAEGPALVPMLSVLVLVPGVNGVLPTRDGGEGREPRTPDDVEAAAIKKARDAGWKILPPDLMIPAEHLPAGVAPGSYRRCTPVISQGARGLRWHDAWETHSSVEGSPAEVAYRRDLLHGWLAAQAKAGAFGEPSPGVVSFMNARLTAELTRKRGLNIPTDLRKDLADEVGKRLDDLKKVVAHG